MMMMMMMAFLPSPENGRSISAANGTSSNKAYITTGFQLKNDQCQHWLSFHSIASIYNHSSFQHQHA